MIVQQPKKVVSYEEYDVAQPQVEELVAPPSFGLGLGNMSVPYAISPDAIPIAAPYMAVPPPFSASQSPVEYVPPQLPQVEVQVQQPWLSPPPQVVVQPPQQRMSLAEWLSVHAMDSYLERLNAEDISELSHFQDLTDDDIQQLVDKWQMPLRTRRNFLMALEVLKQSLAPPPSYDEPLLETKNVSSIVQQFADCVEREDEKEILAIMSSQPKVETLQLKGIEALLELARSDVNKASLVEADAHLVLIQALRNHLRSVSLLEITTGALWHIVLFADFEKGKYSYRDHANESNKEMLIKLDVPSLLVALLRSHPTSNKLAQHCCGIFWSLATVDLGKEVLDELGVQNSVVEAMKAHEKDVQVQVNGCGFLWSFASRKGSPVTVEGGRDAVQAAMQALPNAKQVQKYGLLALRKLPEN